MGRHSRKKSNLKKKEPTPPPSVHDSEEEDMMLLDGPKQHDSDASGEEEVGVFDIGGAASSSDDDGDDDDDSDDGQSDDELDVAGRMPVGDDSDESDESDEDEAHAGTSAWGKHRSDFYDADAMTNELNQQDAEDEEKEALRLQRVQASRLSEQDFALGGLAVKKSSKRASAAEAAGVLGDDSDSDAGVAVIQRKKKSTLTAAQKRKAIAKESPELLALLKDMTAKLNDLRDRVLPVIRAAKDGELETTNGVSYLEIKYQLLLSYIINITFYLLLKLEGRSVRDHPVMDQLHHIRTLLERMKPLDAKLQFQLNKLLNASSAGGELGADADPDAGGLVVAKPRPGALITHDDGSSSDEDMASGKKKKKQKGKKALVEPDEDSDEDEDDVEDDSEEDVGAGKKAKAEGVYKVMRRVAVPFDEDPASAKAEKQAKRRARDLSRSKLLQDIYNDISEKPRLVKQTGDDDDDIDKRLKQRELDREKFEEETFTRQVMSRSERKARAKREREKKRGSRLADFEDFGDLEALIRDEEAAAGPAAGPTGRVTKSGHNLQDFINDVEAAHKATYDKARNATAERTVKPRERKRVSLDDLEKDVGAHFGAEGIGFGEGGLGLGVGAGAGAGAAAGLGSGGVWESDSDDSIIRDAQRRSKHKKSKKEERAEEKKRTVAMLAAASKGDEEVDGERLASSEILRNQGLVKYRNKDHKNPRKHARLKYQKALKRRKGQVQTMRTGEADRYGGEQTGIRTNLSRSHKIK